MRASRSLPRSGAIAREVRRTVAPPRRCVSCNGLGGDGIVEVAGAGWVDGERGQLTQVASLAAFVLDAFTGGAGFALELVIKAASEAPVEHQPLDHVAGNVRAAELAHDVYTGG